MRLLGVRGVACHGNDRSDSEGLIWTCFGATGALGAGMDADPLLIPNDWRGEVNPDDGIRAGRGVMLGSLAECCSWLAAAPLRCATARARLAMPSSCGSAGVGGTQVFSSSTGAMDMRMGLHVGAL